MNSVLEADARILKLMNVGYADDPGRGGTFRRILYLWQFVSFYRELDEETKAEWRA